MASVNPAAKYWIAGAGSRRRLVLRAGRAALGGPAELLQPCHAQPGPARAATPGHASGGRARPECHPDSVRRLLLHDAGAGGQHVLQRLRVLRGQPDARRILAVPGILLGESRLQPAAQVRLPVPEQLRGHLDLPGARLHPVQLARVRAGPRGERGDPWPQHELQQALRPRIHGRRGWPRVSQPGQHRGQTLGKQRQPVDTRKPELRGS